MNFLTIILAGLQWYWVLTIILGVILIFFFILIVINWVMEHKYKGKNVIIKVDHKKTK